MHLIVLRLRGLPVIKIVAVEAELEDDYHNQALPAEARKIGITMEFQRIVPKPDSYGAQQRNRNENGFQSHEQESFG